MISCGYSVDHIREESLSNEAPEGQMQSSYLVVLNAAEGLLQVVIARREQHDRKYAIVCSQNWLAPSQGAELLAPVLADAFTRLHIKSRDIDRLAVIRGPGSFTGLRLAISTASGFGRATNALLAGLDYLPLLARSAAGRLWPLASGRTSKECRVWVLTHARRQLVHMQGFAVHDHAGAPSSADFHSGTPAIRVEPLAGIVVCSPEEAAMHIIAYEEKKGAPDQACLVLGSGLSRNRGSIERVFSEAFKQPEALERGMAEGCGPVGPINAPVPLSSDYDHPLAESLLAAAEVEKYAYEDITPLYVRAPDAEDNFEHIAVSLGLDPVKARERLAALTGGEPSSPDQQ